MVFAALMGVDLPAPPVPVHAAWADGAMLACAGLVALAAATGRLRLSSAGGAALAAVAYVAWATVSAARHGGLVKVLGLAELACVLVAAATLARDEALRDRVLRAWIGAAAALALVGLAAGALAQRGVDVAPLHVGDGELGWRFRPAGLQRVGLLAELLLVPLLACAADGRRLFGRWRGPLAVLFAVTLLLGATRTILAAAVGLLALRAPRRVALAGTAALLVVSLASVRLDVHGTGAPGIRARIWASAAQTIAAHPLTGVGPAAPVAVAGWPGPDDPPRVWDAHATWLNVAAQYGLPALAAFACVFALTLRRASPRLLRAALIATAFDAVTIDVEDFRHVWLLFGLAAAAHGGRTTSPRTGAGTRMSATGAIR